MERIIEISDPVHTFSEVMEHIDLRKYVAERKDCSTGRPKYDPEKLLKVICAATRFNQNRRHNTIREISFGEYKRFPGAELRETVIGKTPVH